MTENYITIDKGDTLWGLAKKYNTTVQELQELNGLKSDFIIRGKQLRLPDNTGIEVEQKKTETNPEKQQSRRNAHARQVAEMKELKNQATKINKPKTKFPNKNEEIASANDTTQPSSSSTTKIHVPKSNITEIACRIAKKYQVDERLILAIIFKESTCINGQTSKKGARGYMQLMPATARSLGVTDVNNPEQNIDAGTNYIKQLLDKYDGNLKKALAAYNWGMGNLAKKGINKAPKETREFIKYITENYQNYHIT